jgi:hypothetical protein
MEIISHISQILPNGPDKVTMTTKVTKKQTKVTVCLFAYKDGQYDIVTPGGKSLEPRVRPLAPEDHIAQQIWARLVPKTRVTIEDSSRAMYHGQVQSGKTFVQYAALWYACFILHRGAVHLLDNKKGSLLQNINRDYPEFCNEIESICVELEVDFREYIFFYKPMTKMYLREAEKSGFSRSPHVVHVAMNNPSQLRHVVRLPLNQREVLVRDESDVFVMADTTKTGPINERLDREAKNLYLFTATPFKNYNLPGAFEHNESIPARETYRGFNDHIHHTVSPDEPMMTTIARVLRDVDPRPFKSVTLIHVDFLNSKHQDMKSEILETFPGQVHVVVLNSRETGLITPVTKMMEDIANCPDDLPWFIIAGQMASRAITFRTQRHCENQAHITAMIYKPAKTTDQTTMIQAVRINGNFDPSVPKIHVYWTPDTKHSVRNSFMNVDEMVKVIEPGVESQECLTRAPIVPNGKLANIDDSEEVSLEHMEFKTAHEAFDFCKHVGGIKKIEVLTEGIEPVSVSQFEYGFGKQKDQQAAIRNQIASRLTNFDSGHHVAWSQERYNQLFNIKFRQNPKHPQYAVAHYTCGNPWLEGPQTKIDCVLWKPEFEDARTFTDSKTIYLFQTTRRTWKVSKWAVGPFE